MSILLSSGATISQSEHGWIVSSPHGTTVSATEYPKAALLLLEEAPTADLLARIDGFPIDALVKLASTSASSRYKAHAQRWQSALRPLSPVRR